MKTRLFITGLAFFAMSTLGLSQNGQPQDKPRNSQSNGPAWVDKNNNGICDIRENGRARQGNGYGYGYCRGRNQGQQGRGMMNGQGRGRYFIDADKNGICDRFENSQNNQADKK
jgi:hypothetical protein